MKNSPAIFLDAGSFIAGLLIGISILVSVFAVMAADPGNWQTQALWLLGAPAILAIGFALQRVLTARSPLRRITALEPGVPPIRLVRLIHEQ
jgi:hypothetical protein